MGACMDNQEPASAIRRANVEDVAAVATLLHAAFASYEATYTPEGFAATTPAADELARRLADGPTWVATRAGVIVGTVSATPRGDALYMRSMAVHPAAQGHGLARALLAQVEDFAIAQGASRIILSTTPFLHDAIRLYERNGFLRNAEGPHTLFGTPLFTMTKPLP